VLSCESGTPTPADPDGPMDATPATLLAALDVTQEFGPERQRSREARLRAKLPTLGDREVLSALAWCDRLEARAFDLATEVLSGRRTEASLGLQLGIEFPLLDEERLARTASQAMYFASK
jgi:hypothetical protein